jgi:uncharacterized membrane protein YdjX (TVP38/TMEM64 family)
MSEGKEQSKNLWFRLGGMLLFIITTILLVKYTSIGTWLSLDSMKYMVEKTGMWGVLIFIAISVVAAVMNIPGTGFLLLAILLFGYWKGAIFAYLAALLGAWVTFTLGRVLGGKALTEIKNPTVKNLLLQAEVRPIRTLIVLRILLQFSPIIGYTLALTNIKQRQYLIGNIIGILIPTIGISVGMYFFEDTVRAFF